MRFSPPLIPGRLVRRYNRFLADIELDSGEPITAHCANPGALLGGTTPGLRVWVSYAPSPTRKLSYSWQIVEMEGTYVGVNTSLPNYLAEEAILAGRIPELSGYDVLKREVKYGENSRIDWLLTHSGDEVKGSQAELSSGLLDPSSGEFPEKRGKRPPCYVEVKNVHLKRGEAAAFPDSVTTRGAKHLRELEGVVAQGHRAVMLYMIQRNDCTHFRFAADIDPAYAAAAAQAFSHGVEALAYLCTVTPEGITVERRIDLLL